MSMAASPTASWLSRSIARAPSMLRSCPRSRIALAVPEHRLRFRRRQTLALPAQRPEKSNECLWTEQSPCRRAGLEILPEVCIARTSWLFGRRQVLSRNHSEAGLDPFRDFRGKQSAWQPHFHPRSASALVELCRAKANGIVHVTNSGNCKLARVRHRNRHGRPRGHGRIWVDHRRVPASSKASRLLGSVARQPARL